MTSASSSSSSDELMVKDFTKSTLTSQESSDGSAVGSITHLRSKLNIMKSTLTTPTETSDESDVVSLRSRL